MNVEMFPCRKDFLKQQGRRGKRVRLLQQSPPTFSLPRPPPPNSAQQGKSLGGLIRSSLKRNSPAKDKWQNRSRTRCIWDADLSWHRLSFRLIKPGSISSLPRRNNFIKGTFFPQGGRERNGPAGSWVGGGVTERPPSLKEEGQHTYSWDTTESPGEVFNRQISSVPALLPQIQLDKTELRYSHLQIC